MGLVDTLRIERKQVEGSQDLSWGLGNLHISSLSSAYAPTLQRNYKEQSWGSSKETTDERCLAYPSKDACPQLSLAN